MSRFVNQIKPLSRTPPPLNGPVFVNLPEATAADRAIQETVGLNNLSAFNESMDGNLQESTFLLDVTKELHASITSEALQEAFTRDIQASTSDEEAQDVLLRYSEAINRDNTDIRTLTYLEFLRNNQSEEVTVDGYNTYIADNLNLQDIHNLRFQFSQPAVDEMRRLIDEYVADKAFVGVAEPGKEILRAAFQPFQEQGLTELASEADILPDGETGYWSGSARQRIRDALSNMSDENRLAAVRRFIDLVRQKEKDPVWGVALADFAIVDFIQNVLTEDVLRGQQDTATFDVWLNNIVTAMDSVALAGTVARTLGRGTRSLQGLLSNRGSRPSIRSANGISTPSSRSIGDALRDDPRTSELVQVDEVEALAADLPKPESIVDQMTPIPDRIASVTEQAAALRTRVIELANSIPSRWHSTKNKIDLVARETEAIANSTRGVVRRAMSTIGRIVNATGADLGFRVRAIIGATESAGWKGFVGFDDITEVVKDFNPEAGLIEIVSRKADGTLETIYTAPRQIGGTAGIDDIKPFLARNIGLTEDNEFFIRITKDRYYTPEDTLLFGDSPTLRSGPFSRIFLTPFTKFTKAVYDQVNLTFGTEQAIHKELSRMLDSVYSLSDDSKRKIFGMMEWTNDYAKTTRQNPTISDYLTEFPDITDRELAAIVSLREAQDAWWTVLNLRLRRNWEARGFLTAYNDSLPTYHGKARDDVYPESFYDPVTRQGVALTRKDLDEFYRSGGRLMEVDMPIELPSSPRIKFNYVAIDPKAGYSIEALAPAVLDYHPGYFLKFYEDSYGLVKRYKNVVVDGRPQSVVPSRANSPEFMSLIRTTNAYNRGRDLAKRANARLVERRAGGREANYEYDVIALRDLNVQEQTAYLSQLLNRQGRMFYDERSYKMMKNLDGEVTELMNPIKALERGVSVLARQLGTEDTLRSLKTKFQEQYADLIDPLKWKVSDSKGIYNELKKLSGDSTLDKAKNKRINDAIDLWQYIRTLEGVDSDFFFNLRKWSLMKAQRLGSPTLEKAVINLQPLQATRAFVFKAFMVTRPVRQLLLQSAQILFLAGIDTKYILSGKILRDALAIRLGMGAKMGVEAGFSTKALAKSMGLSTQEYTTLVNRLEDSGLLDHVDVHSFVGNSRRFHRLGLPKTQLGSAAQIPVKVGSYAVETLQRYGFDLGERNNLTFTYLVALRREMKKRGYTKVTELDNEMWDNIAVDASNMSFGMIRPNQAFYQSGPLSLATQFVSFGHKALLSMLGFNPSISKKEAVKIWATSFVLYGAGMFGAREAAESWLADKTYNSPGFSPKAREIFIDVASGGLVDYITNKTAALLFDEWQDLDLDSFAPGVGTLVTFNKNMIEAASEGPAWPVFFGPASSIGSNIMRASATASVIYHGDPDMSPADKFRITADEMLRAVFPGYSDYMRAYTAKKMGEWYSLSGMPTDLRPTWNALLARGLVGINTHEMNAYYTIRNDETAKRLAIEDKVRQDKNTITRLMNLYLEGQLTYENLVQRAIVIGNLTAEMPEDEQIMYYTMMQDAEVGDFNLTEYLSTLAAENRFAPSTLYHAGNIDSLEPQEWDALKGYLDTFQRDYTQSREFLENRINMEEQRFLEDGN